MFVSSALSLLNLRNLKFKRIRVKTKKKRKKIIRFFRKHQKWLHCIRKNLIVNFKKWNLSNYDMNHRIFYLIRKKKKKRCLKSKFFTKLSKKNKFITKKHKLHYELYFKFLNKFIINKKKLIFNFKKTKYFGKLLYMYLKKKLKKKLKKIKLKRFKWKRRRGKKYKKIKKLKLFIKINHRYIKDFRETTKFSYQYNFVKTKKLKNYKIFLKKIIYKIKNNSKTVRYKTIYKTNKSNVIIYYALLSKRLDSKTYNVNIKKIIKYKKKTYILKFKKLPKIKKKKVFSNNFYLKILKEEKKIKLQNFKFKKIFKIKWKLFKIVSKRRRRFIKYFFFTRKFKMVRKGRRRKKKKFKVKKGFLRKNFKKMKRYNKNVHRFLKNVKKFLFLKKNYWIIKLTKSVDFMSTYTNQYRNKTKLIKKATVLFLRKRKKKLIRIHKRYKKYSKYKKKIYKYIKVKKLSKYRSLSNYININQTKNYYINRRKMGIIFNCMYLNKYTASHYFLNFFKITKLIKTYKKSFLKKKIVKYSSYKTNKYKYGYHKKYIKKNRIWQNYKSNRRKTYFFNSWRGLLVTWKDARLYHWKMYKKGTLKKRRYRNFLPAFLEKIKVKLDVIINYFSFKFKFSNLFWKEFSKVYLYFFDKQLKKKEIFQIPISLIFWVFLNKLKKSKRKIKKKVKSWLYRNIRIRQTFWMELKKKTPKFFSYQLFNFNKVNSAIQYDFITNYFSVLKDCISFESINEYIFNNKLLKMHNFRFKS